MHEVGRESSENALQVTFYVSWEILCSEFTKTGRGSYLTDETHERGLNEACEMRNAYALSSGARRITGIGVYFLS